MVDLYGGHIIPGVGYIAYAFWWSLTTTFRYVQSNEKNGRPYKSSVSMPAIFLPAYTPWYIRHPAFESCFRLVCSFVGLLFHPIDALDDYYKASTATVHDAHRWDMIYRVKHHFALYLAFAIGAIVEVCIFIFDEYLILIFLKLIYLRF